MLNNYLLGSDVQLPRPIRTLAQREGRRPDSRWRELCEERLLGKNEPGALSIFDILGIFRNYAKHNWFE